MKYKKNLEKKCKKCESFYTYRTLTHKVCRNCGYRQKIKDSKKSKKKVRKNE